MNLLLSGLGLKAENKCHLCYLQVHKMKIIAKICDNSYNSKMAASILLNPLYQRNPHPLYFVLKQIEFRFMVVYMMQNEQ